MNFASLKIGFLEYLKKEGIISSTKETKLDSISIFSYQEEFKEYLKEQNIDTTALSFEYSNLNDLNVLDGKIVSSIKDEENFTMDMFNDLLENEEFIELLDGDEDKKLSDEEIQYFLKFASSDDGDDKNLSFDDLFKSYDKAKSGKYDKSALSKIKELEDTSSASSTGGGSFSGYNPTNSNGATKDKADENSIENLSYDALQSKKTEQQNAVDTKRSELNQIYSNDQQAVEDTKAAYDEAISKDNIDPALKASRDANIEAIATQDKLISSLKTTLSDLDGQISSKESELNAIVSSKQALNEALSAIESLTMTSGSAVNLVQDGSGEQIVGLNSLAETPNATLTTEVQTQIANNKASIASELATIEQKETTLTQELEDLKSQKTTREGELSTAQGALTTLEEEKTTIDSQILEKCNEETRMALEAYNAARTTAKSNAKVGEDNLKLAKDELTKIETEINSRDAQSIKNKYAISTGEVFDDNSTLKWDYLSGETTLPYGVIAPDDVNPDEELPVLLFLHGSGEVGNKTGLYNVATQNFIDTDLENFRGYIICPHLAGGGNWSNDNSMKYIGEIINNFSQTHNIDYDNIAISGHSLGGIGTIYATENNRFEELTGIKISKSVILSGYAYNKKKGVENLGVDTKVYVGSSGDGTSKWEMEHYLVETGIVDESDYKILDGSTHGSLDQDAFLLDEDGNGRSDIFEWVFEDKENSDYYSNL